MIGADYDGGIQIASRNPQYELIQELYNHTDVVISVRITADKKHFVAIGNDGKVSLWTATAGRF